MSWNEDNDVKGCDLFVNRITSVSYPHVIGGLTAETSFDIKEWRCITSRWDLIYSIQFQFTDEKPKSKKDFYHFRLGWLSTNSSQNSPFCAGDQL